MVGNDDRICSGPAGQDVAGDAPSSMATCRTALLVLCHHLLWPLTSGFYKICILEAEFPNMDRRLQEDADPVAGARPPAHVHVPERRHVHVPERRLFAHAHAPIHVHVPQNPLTSGETDPRISLVLCGTEVKTWEAVDQNNPSWTTCWQDASSGLSWNCPVRTRGRTGERLLAAPQLHLLAFPALHRSPRTHIHTHGHGSPISRQISIRAIDRDEGLLDQDDVIGYQDLSFPWDQVRTARSAWLDWHTCRTRPDAQSTTLTDCT